MVYKVVYTEIAQKDLLRLDRPLVQRILRKVKEFSDLQNPLIKAKKLKGFEIDTFRFRVGDYRVIFRLDKETHKLVVVVVLRVRHRKEVYKQKD